MDLVKQNLKSPAKHGRQVYCKERNKLINMTTELQRIWEEKYVSFPILCTCCQKPYFPTKFKSSIDVRSVPLSNKIQK